jgi:hypothetical protein
MFSQPSFLPSLRSKNFPVLEHPQSTFFNVKKGLRDCGIKRANRIKIVVLYLDFIEKNINDSKIIIDFKGPPQ